MRILGVSPAHDSSIVIMNDGNVEYFSKEERISRVKRDKNPWKAILEGIKEVGGGFDYVAWASPNTRGFEGIKQMEIISKLLGCEVVNYCDKHHICHASLAFNNSNFDESLVFVIDRNGSDFFNSMRESESVIVGSQKEGLKEIHKNFWVFNQGVDSNTNNNNILKYFNKKKDFSFNIGNRMSIIKIYESATILIGQHPLENGKVMGLSSYGEDKKGIDLFFNNRPIDNLFIEDRRGVLLSSHLDKVTNNVTKDNFKFYADYSYQVQKQTQEQVLNLVKEWVEKTGIKNVCMSGGYAFNVVANQFLIKNLPHINFYFEPSGDDSGNSIGAALHLHKEISGDNSSKPITTQYLGKKYLKEDLLKGIKKYLA